MAETLGFAASIISVASLAIQLGDGVRKAWKFAESIEDGPEDIRRVSADLRWLANYLSTLGDEFETGNGDRVQEMLAMEVLETIKGDIDSLATLVAELSSKIAPNQRTWKRKWAKIQTVLKESKIAKMREYIHNAIRNLQLLQTSRLQSSLLQMNGKLHLLTAKFNSETRNKAESTSQSILSPSLLIEESSTQQVDSLDQSTEQTPALAPNPKNMRILAATAVQFIDAGLGVLTFKTTSSTFIKSSEDDKDKKTIVKGKKVFAINLIFRLLSCRRGFSVNTNETFDSWTFNTIRKRPDESPIFLKSEQGDLQGVQELILSGQASVFDINTEGWTPLHVC